MSPPALDLCCGDGFLASLIWPEGIDAGCDISVPALKRATSRENYNGVICCDVTGCLPFQSRSFHTVVSNSSVEHLRDVDNALEEVARVLKPGGRLYLTLASHHAYRWWPCGQAALKRYLEYQPVRSCFSLQEWTRHMRVAGLRVIDHQYYLSKRATRLFLFLDYHYSHVHMTSDSTLARPIVRRMRLVPERMWAACWKRMFARIGIPTQGEGGGILIVAERAE